MAFLSMALVIGAVVGAFVTGGAIDRGFPWEVALVRGAVGFMAIAFVGYLGELVVVTAPKRAERDERRPAPPDAAEEPQAPNARPAAPRLMAPAPTVAEDNNKDDADVELRPAA